MTKSEAATLLGVSEKTIQNYIKKGRLTVAYVPGKTSPIATFDPQEVESLKAEMETLVAKVETGNAQNGGREVQNPKAEPGKTLAVLPSTFPSNPSITISASDLPVLAQALVNALVTPPIAVPTADKTTLTLTEAKELTGFSERRLRQAVKAGKLKVMRIGRADRLLRATLDKWVIEQFQVE